MPHTQELNEFEDEYGQPSHFVSAEAAALDLSDSGLPQLIFSYWRRFGFSKYLDGYFQFIDPRLYDASLERWLSKTEFSSGDHYYPVRMNAFGDINIIGVKTGQAFETSVHFHSLIKAMRDDRDLISNGRADSIVGSIAFQTLAENFLPVSDNSGIRIFFAAKDKLGLLGPNQIYAPVPAIPLGGQMRIEDLQIVDAPEYLTMVAELAPVRVMTIADLARMAYGDGSDATLNGLLKK